MLVYGLFAILLLTALSMFGFVVSIYWQQRIHTNIYLVALIFVCGIYPLGYSLEILAQTLKWKMVFLYVEYLGISFIPPFALLTALTFSRGNASRVVSVIRWPLYLISLITFASALTTAQYGFLYERFWIKTSGPFRMLTFTTGTWYWVQVGYIQIAGIISLLIYLKQWIFSSSRHRHIAAYMFLGSIFPFVSHIVYISGLIPHNIDSSPFSMALSSAVFYWAIYHSDFARIRPIAREKTFEWMKDAALVLDTAGNPLDYNQSFQKLFLQNQKIPLSKVFDTVNKDFPEMSELFIKKQNENSEKIFKIANKHFHVSRVDVPDFRQKVMGYVFVFHDITAQMEMVSMLKKLATTDELTGLYNRRYFSEISQKEVQRAMRYKRELSVGIIDVDHFKKINDQYGHDAGDTVLKMLAQVFQNTLRASDLVARYGGEEFVCLFPETGAEGAKIIAGRLKQSVEDLIWQNPINNLKVTVSIGLCSLKNFEDKQTVSEWISNLTRNADRALYAAKNRGRNQVIHFNEL